jgi:phosphatidylglycerophosphate synthase
METAARKLSFLLAEPERRVLRWVAARLPSSWTPNLLTAIGVSGAVLVGAGYALARFHPAWFWLASLGLAVNWFGDSLDGTLARVRHIERPRYGYYIDHMVDAFNTALIGAGIGLSGYVSLPVALLVVILYLALSINVYLESSVLGVFDLGYGIFGPTEMRLLLMLVNTGLFAGASWAGVSAASVAAVGNAVLWAGCVMMVLSLAARFAKNLARLARVEPARRT